MRFDTPKIVLSVVWAMILANFVVNFPEWLARALHLLGALLAVAHLTEYVIFHQRIARRPEGAVVAFVMNFFFGLFYWMAPLENSKGRTT
jgi:uncharacterized protein YhhL (DUF1145 family)